MSLGALDAALPALRELTHPPAEPPKRPHRRLEWPAMGVAEAA
jgi:hypothetical protein